MQKSVFHKFLLAKVSALKVIKLAFPFRSSISKLFSIIALNKHSLHIETTPTNFALEGEEELRNSKPVFEQDCSLSYPPRSSKYYLNQRCKANLTADSLPKKDPGNKVDLDGKEDDVAYKICI